MGERIDRATIYVSNIAAAVTEDTLRKFFSFCGSIKSFSILGYVITQLIICTLATVLTSAI